MSRPSDSYYKKIMALETQRSHFTKVSVFWQRSNVQGNRHTRFDYNLQGFISTCHRKQEGSPCRERGTLLPAFSWSWSASLIRISTPLDIFEGFTNFMPKENYRWWKYISVFWDEPAIQILSDSAHQVKRYEFLKSYPILQEFWWVKVVLVVKENRTLQKL